MQDTANKVKLFRTIPLTIDIKKRLLKSMQAGKLNMSNFPEFDEVGINSQEIDISDFTDEEKKVLLKIARRI
jgi:hypothetical protein